MRLHDTRLFYHHLRALGVHVHGKSFEGSQPFSLEEATTFVEGVGNEPFELPPNLEDLLPPQQAAAWDLDTTPSEAEILSSLGKMKDTKGGTDGITVYRVYPSHGAMVPALSRDGYTKSLEHGANKLGSDRP